jgi:hypothetical protein
MTHILLAAAHCVWQQLNKKLEPEAILIYLGKYDLFNWTEHQDVQPKYVSMH